MALDAATEAIQSPKDEDAQAALRLQLKKLFTDNAGLGDEIAELLKDAKTSRRSGSQRVGRPQRSDRRQRQ